MRNREMRVGPGAASIILIIVVLCMCVLGMLSLSAARQDARLSGRAAVVAEKTAALNARAEIHRMALDEALAKASHLPDGMIREGDTVTWTETDEDGRELHCAVRVDAVTNRAMNWTEHRVMPVAGVEFDDFD